MSISWSDSDDESEKETTNRVMYFTKKYEFGSESSDEDIYDKELVEA